MDKKPKIITHLEKIAPFIPFPIYWGDITTFKVLGANKSCLDAMGAKTPADVIGKTPYDYYPKKIADNIIEHVKKVVNKKIPLSQEDVIQDITTGKIRYYTAIRAPLFDGNNKVIAIVGTSIEITVQKEAERLQLESQKAKIATQEEFITIINEFNHILQKHKFNILNRDLGVKDKLDGSDKNKKIHLSPREQEILYYLSLNKSPKAIASILSILDDTKILPSTIQATINKRMYFKFDVNNTDELIEKASHLNLIPVLLPKRIK